jgi:hypothetical protein
MVKVVKFSDDIIGNILGTTSKLSVASEFSTTLEIALDAVAFLVCHGKQTFVIPEIQQTIKNFP